MDERKEALVVFPPKSLSTAFIGAVAIGQY
jgi:hypothetical protein